MKSFKKVLAVVMTVIMVFGCMSITSFAAEKEKRYSILVLDVSGSMSGEPIAAVKEAAKGFCEQVLNTSAKDNYIAIVTFASSSKVVSEFSNNITDLQAVIDNIYDGGGTYLAPALSNAKTLMEQVGEGTKNIFVFCDGDPFDSESAYNVIRSMPLEWNLYGLYFSQSGYNQSAADVMLNVARGNSNNYYEIKDASMIKTIVSEEWSQEVEDSLEAANYVVIRVACPVDVSITHNGETLNKFNTQTFFGKLEFDGENDEIKVLTLSYNDEYKIEITGTGTGVMDYSIKYMHNNDVIREQAYPTVSITPSTKIITGVNIEDDSITLDVDSDGDGTIDTKVAPIGSDSGNTMTIFGFIFGWIAAVVASIFDFLFGWLC